MIIIYSKVYIITLYSIRGAKTSVYLLWVIFEVAGPILRDFHWHIAVKKNLFIIFTRARYVVGVAADENAGKIIAK